MTRNPMAVEIWIRAAVAHKAVDKRRQLHRQQAAVAQVRRELVALREHDRQPTVQAARCRKVTSRAAPDNQAPARILQ